MTINPNAPFHRMYVDLPMDVALQLEAHTAKTKTAKKQFVADAIAAALKSNTKRGKK